MCQRQAKQPTLTNNTKGIGGVLSHVSKAIGGELRGLSRKGIESTTVMKVWPTSCDCMADDYFGIISELVSEILLAPSLPSYHYKPRKMIYFLLPDSILPSPLRPAPTALLKFDNTPPPTFVTLDTVAFPAFDALLADWLPAFVILVAVGQ